MYLITEPIDIFIVNYFIAIRTGYIITMLKASDVLTGNTNHYFRNFHSRRCFSILYRLLNGLNGLCNIVNHSSMHTKTFGFTNTHNLHLSVIIFTPNHSHNFCGSYVQSNRNVIIFHVLFFCSHYLTSKL